MVYEYSNILYIHTHDETHHTRPHTCAHTCVSGSFMNSGCVSGSQSSGRGLPLYVFAIRSNASSSSKSLRFCSWCTETKGRHNARKCKSEN